MWVAPGGLCSGNSGPDAPSESGRVSAGDVVSPTGGTLSPATGVTAPALGTETTALGLETPTLSPSPRPPWGTPAASQAQTPGTPPRRAGSSVVEQDRNSTGQGMEEVSSVSTGLGKGQWTASRAPGPTHTSLPGATDSLQDPSGWLWRNSTMESSFWATPTEGPTGHVVWDTSLPTRDTSPAPLDPTQPQNSDPGPSGSPDLPLAPSPTSLKTPACGECLEWGILGDVCPEAQEHWEPHGPCEVQESKAHTVVESKAF